MRCPKCGNELKRSQKNPEYGLCYNCRLKFKWVEKNVCSKCGMKYNGKFCPECGYSEKTNQDFDKKKSIEIICGRCGTRYDGKFCPNCGESADSNFGGLNGDATNADVSLRVKKDKQKKKKNFSMKKHIRNCLIRAAVIMAILIIGERAIDFIDSSREDASDEIINKLLTISSIGSGLFEYSNYYFLDNDQEWVIIYNSENEIISFENSNLVQSVEEILGIGCYEEDAFSFGGFMYDIDENEGRLYVNGTFEDGELSIISYDFSKEEYSIMLNQEHYKPSKNLENLLIEYEIASLMKNDIELFEKDLEQVDLDIEMIQDISYEDVELYAKQDLTAMEEENESNEMTLEEYLNSCIEVSNADIARNPSAYVGKNIIIEGSLGNTAGVLSIGLWTTEHPITILYDGVAYDANLNPMGEVLNSDYGYVAGTYTSDDKIEAKIIVVLNDEANEALTQNDKVEEFVGQEGTYICMNSEEDWLTGKIEVLSIGEEIISFSLGTLDFEYDVLGGDATLISNNKAKFEQDGFTLYLEWTDSENIYVTHEGEITGMEAGTIDTLTDGMQYYRELEFNQ